MADEDESMLDVNAAEVEDNAESEAEQGADDGAEEEEEGGDTPQVEGAEEGTEGKEEDEAEPSTVDSAKEPTPPPAEPVIRRKRLGRPPKNKPPDWDLGVVVSERDSDATPRRRGRGGWRGRGGRKGAQVPQKLQQTIDKEGTVVDIINDECVLPECPEGETKVDKLGNLMGGRDYRCRTFAVQGRGDRLYMLSTEPARCVGFRDSYLFFTKHLRLHKIIVDDDEKRDMIEREIIPHSYKGRAIGIVTARSVFREFGARIIIGGRRIIDDYDEAKARAEGAVEGEIADPTDRFVEGEPYNKNQYVAWHGASAVYHQSAPAVQAPVGKPEVKKRRVNVNDTNWMYEHAKEASNFNSMLTAARAYQSKGIYDIHTNMMHFPATMQPTHARIEQVPLADGESPSESKAFPDVPPRVVRNFLVMDTYMETPPSGISAAAYGKTINADFLTPFRGLNAVSDDIKDLLPPECRKAFDDASAQELEWKARWGSESEATCRRNPIIDKAIVRLVEYFESVDSYWMDYMYGLFRHRLAGSKVERRRLKEEEKA
ncbi:related to nuclear localization protein NPL6 [Cephalotrichum gorgonifer]|uniref:Related to nuclear localization protein NPL6 n=1 Tax=Cephalotrichum gorgonifer TaxID=2041049 RepID=A0AAE8MP23_9PEZI|nr:related to nuclear localization protein NPL6 [Cephalotrichum gorgonifer]